MALRFGFLLFAVGLLIGCGESTTTSIEDFNSTKVNLPGGRVIRAEKMVQAKDMARGMMFRDSLADDRGMLFVHGTPGKYTYWMYQVRVPLDILWLDANRNIVEISADTPPCPAKDSNACPLFGGHEDALYILELKAGTVKRDGLQLGQRVIF